MVPKVQIRRSDRAGVAPSRAASPVAGYTLDRPIGASRLGPRWLAHAEPTREAAVACRIGGPGTGIERRAAREVVGRLRRLEHRHILRLLSTTTDAEGEAWIVTPYTGTHDGLTTLSGLVELKGGALSDRETRAVIEQLLDASACAHEQGEAHGPILIDDVLVTRRGSVVIELYGVARRLLAPDMPVEELRREEIASCAHLASELLTGLPAQEAARSLRRVARGWRSWIQAVLDPATGIADASEALDAIPGR